MNLKRTSLGLAVLFVGAGVGVGCTDSGGSCEDTLTCGSGGSAGSGGTAGTSGSGGTAGSGASGGSAGSGASGGAAGSGASGGSAGTAGAGGTGQQCDPTSAPGEDACVIDDEYAVFVSPNGDDSAGDGSMASPFASIAKGITEAIAAGKRLYACADGGSYDEQVALDANNAGVSAWGSFKCSDWTYDNSLKASVAPSAEGFALSASGVNATTRLEGFEFQAQSATSAGASSIAAFVKDSSALTLVNVKLVAGDGMKGADGQTPVSTFPSTDDLRGNPGSNASGLPGGARKIYAQCPNGGQTAGGRGGDGAALPATPEGGSAGEPAALGGAAGTVVGLCAGPGTGGQGQPPTAAAPGNGAITTGSLVSDVWTPEDGSNGAPGMPGGGGGGGRGGTVGGGGGGGAGGCGGAGGAPGQGGGASIALLAIEAPINLVNVEFVSASAGNGGAGSAGENGMAVGGGGGSEPADGCPGGDGGAGGKGGAGGGGAGGIAVGLVFTGNQPTLSGESFSAGTAGAAGPGGDSSNAGVAGVAQDTLDLN